jgi:glutathione synthase/RimK-type ligase-like ATP-grasp enzyme
LTKRIVSSLSVNKPIQLGLVGNLENRRIQDFCVRWQALGQPMPTLMDYQELPSVAPRVDAIRIDSPGENANLALRLIAMGGGPQGAKLEFGEVAYLREFHLGYCALLARIEEWRLPALSAPSEIATMFDKWQSHQRFLEAGLSRPPSALAPSSYAEWQKQRAEHGRLFLKPLHGSSSSGVCALRWTPSRQQLKSPIRIAGGRLFNSLRVQSYETWQEIAFILTRLLPQGMIAETWIPKLKLADGAVDVRVLVIAGEARHAVVRQSHSPMTNLHLGNRRADPSGLEAPLAAASRLAEKAAACFPNSLYAGVDILLDLKARPYIGEINAFGDLLPGLSHRGEDPYTAIARAYLSLPC